MVDLAELNENTIPEGRKTDLGVWVGDASVVLSGTGFDPEESYRILKSVQPDRE